MSLFDTYAFTVDLFYLKYDTTVYQLF